MKGPFAVIELLRARIDGDEAALDRLIPLVESALRRLARIYMARERLGHTYARARGMQRRGGGAFTVPLDDDVAVSAARDFNLLALDRALGALSVVDERTCRVIQMRFCGGLTVEETAEALSVSPDTVKRDWRLAKLWLLRELEGVTP